MSDPQLTEAGDVDVDDVDVSAGDSPADRDPQAGGLSEREFSCHCCYDILINPTTLNCGHSFCRHCLALWWESAGKNECPECRERWEGFPKVNILLRDAVEKLFQADVQRRRQEIQNNPRIAHSLLAFQRHGDEQASRGAPPGGPRRGAGSFFTGVLTALTAVAVMLLVYHWSSGEAHHEVLVSKPVSKWTTDDVTLWMEHLGAWANQYREIFIEEKVNGRLLTLLSDEELSRPPYGIENPSHRRAVLEELHKVRELGVKPPQNLWEYKAVNGGKSLFLLYALKDSPRLSILYLYLFDYEDTFLPFIHTCCPTRPPHPHLDDSPSRTPQVEPTWRQWVEFLVKFSLLPYQLLAEFAWDWLSVHYWTSRFVIVNAMLLSVLEGCSFWRVWSRGEIRTLPKRMFGHLWKMLTHSLAFMLFWPLVPQFVCNCLFYWALYFNPIINIDMVVQQLMHTHTHHA
ncbi:bifunctional apoptosis regulator-like isoform X1 [Colossoma macropomum]|uniref:bifunctional apoptosis regulator-like isoform X1 n=1 Tax=Colossoma macropomum TaxID=42526 RepID=UPI00186470FB|nr:bifunctional apoptosis regulator-like isoform X1 [Colossoma macropomum]